MCPVLMTPLVNSVPTDVCKMKQMVSTPSVYSVYVFSLVKPLQEEPGRAAEVKWSRLWLLLGSPGASAQEGCSQVM